MSKDAPDPPDYAGAAREQAQASREVTEQQTWANRPTINTPFGQQTWESTPVWDPATGQYLNSWTQNTNLTPDSQAALDSQMRVQRGRSGMAENMLGRSQSEFSKEMDWNQFTPLDPSLEGNQYSTENIQRNLDTGGLQDVDPSSRYYDGAENAMMGRFNKRQEPRMAQEMEQTRTRLYNQGLREGDQAFDSEIQRLRQDQNDAREMAQFGATQAAGQEASRIFGMDSGARQQQFSERQAGGTFANSAAQQAMQQQLAVGGQRFGEQQAVANYGNTVRQQQIAEQMQRRGFSLNEVNAILTGQQVGMPGMPGFNAANRSEGTQALQAAGMQGQANLDAFSAEQQGTQGLLSGLAGGAMMFSDRRLKKDIRFSRMIGKFKFYTWTWIWGGTGFGVMADEVPPSFVHTLPSGLRMVDYGQVMYER